MSPLKVLFSGGGTGGHVFPGIAVWRALKEMEPDAGALWLITDRGESRHLIAEGIPFVILWVVPLTFKPHSMVFYVTSLFQALGEIRRFRPDVCLATGGYASVPGALACRWLGIPVVVLETNVVPGKATRLLSRVARAVIVANEETARALPQAHAALLGVPIRTEAEVADRTDALRRFGLSTDRTHLLVTGGSLGAVSLNHAVLEAVGQMPVETRRGLEILHQTGKEHEVWVRERWAALGVKADVRAFFEDLPQALVASDIVVARAGATTVAEVLAAGRPALIVPYPHAGAHQTPNAKAAEAAGAAVVVEESDPQFAAKFGAALARLLTSPEERAKMAAAARAAARPTAAADVAKFLLRIAGA